MCSLLSKEESPFYKVKNGNSERSLFDSTAFYYPLISELFQTDHSEKVTVGIKLINNKCKSALFVPKDIEQSCKYIHTYKVTGIWQEQNEIRLRFFLPMIITYI